MTNKNYSSPEIVIVKFIPADVVTGSEPEKKDNNLGEIDWKK